MLMMMMVVRFRKLKESLQEGDEGFDMPQSLPNLE